MWQPGVLGHETGPREKKMVATFTRTDSQVLPTILELFLVIFDDLNQIAHLRLQHGDIKAVETSATSTPSVETRQMPVLQQTTSVLYQQQTSVLFQQ